MRLKKREIWKSLQDFPDYAISNEGRIKRLSFGKGTCPGNILNPIITNTGYLMVNLRKNKKEKQKAFHIHRLVLETFIGPCPEGHCGHHKDETKTNNFLINLEYILRSEHTRNHHLGKIGWNKGIPCSEETKQKISETNRGEKNHFYGKTHSDETKQKMSKAKKGRVSPLKGIPLSEETKQKMRKPHKNYKKRSDYANTHRL